MIFKVRIDTENAMFEDMGQGNALALLLNRLADSLEGVELNDDDQIPVLDSNGLTVGEAWTEIKPQGCDAIGHDWVPESDQLTLEDAADEWIRALGERGIDAPEPRGYWCRCARCYQVEYRDIPIRGALSLHKRRGGG